MTFHLPRNTSTSNVVLAPATPCTVEWWPYEQPESPLRITITEDAEEGVRISGLNIPEEQLQNLCELLEVWKYGLIKAEVE